MAKFTKKKKYLKLDEVFEFGFHKGKTIKEIVSTDKTYFDWCKKNVQGFFISKEIKDYITDYSEFNKDLTKERIYPDFYFKRNDKDKIELLFKYFGILFNVNRCNLTFELLSDWILIKNHQTLSKCQLTYEKLYLLSDIKNRLKI